MAALQVTARKSQPALRGQAVRIYLDSTESTTDLQVIVVGDNVGIVSSGFQGKVLSVDYFGHSFLAKPNTTNSTLESLTTPGLLNNGELVNIN